MTQEELDKFTERLRGLSDEVLLQEFNYHSGLAYYQKLEMKDGYKETAQESELYYQELLARLTVRRPV